MQITRADQGRLITSLADLEELSSWSNLLARAERMELDLPGLTSEEKSRYESLIHSHTAACGCAEGRMFLGSLVMGYILYLSFRAQGWRGAGWREFGVGFGLACLGAVLGKVYGLLSSRLRLRALVASLRGLSA